MTSKQPVTAVVISPSWPVQNSGSGFATASALRQYARIVSRVRFVGMVDRKFTERDAWYPQEIEFTHIPIKRLSTAARFALTMASPLPAICHQFSSSLIRKHVLDIVSEESTRAVRTVVIFEDVPIAVALLDVVRARFPTLSVAIRSQNLASRIFVPLRDTGSVLRRVAWRIEVAKIRQQESKACRLADQVWAISANDLEGYRDQLGIHCDGVVGASVDINRYSSVPEGDPYTLVSIGTFDLRKSHGLLKFIERSWPGILGRYPAAKLFLGGAHSKQFTNPKLNILGVGQVEDDRTILGQGLIVLNTQEIGAGINLKSIVAMTSGKALVSTQKGVEGIEGKVGEHFLVGTYSESLSTPILELMEDILRARQMGKAARELAARVYSDARLGEQIRPLLSQLFGLQTW